MNEPSPFDKRWTWWKGQPIKSEEADMNMVVLDGHTLNPGDNSWDRVAALGPLKVYDRTPEDQIISRAAEADILLTNKTPLSAQTLAHLPRLKYISVLATGYNVVDVKAARARNIPVSNVPIYGTDTVAQHVFAVLLSMVHQPVRHDEAVRQGEWKKSGDFCFWKQPLIELAGLKMGIVGFGRIGRKVGEVAHALGMEVLAYTIHPSNPPSYQPFAWRSMDDLFAQSDVVSLHCPQTADNAGFVNQALIQKMKPSAWFINAARGGLVNEQDLADALNQGRIAGAALDVFTAEPIRDDSPLLQAKNCLITPHMAWATVAARKRLMGTTADNIAGFLAGNPINVVNAQ